MSLKAMEETAGDHETPLLNSTYVSGVQPVESPTKRTGWYMFIAFPPLDDIIQLPKGMIEDPDSVYLFLKKGAYNDSEFD